MTWDRHSYLPLILPVWFESRQLEAEPAQLSAFHPGLSKGQVLHVNTRANWLFHIYDGFILGATAYPGMCLMSRFAPVAELCRSLCLPSCWPFAFD